MERLPDGFFMSPRKARTRIARCCCHGCSSNGQSNGSACCAPICLISMRRVLQGMDAFGFPMVRVPTPHGSNAQDGSMHEDSHGLPVADNPGPVGNTIRRGSPSNTVAPKESLILKKISPGSLDGFAPKAQINKKAARQVQVPNRAQGNQRKDGPGLRLPQRGKQKNKSSSGKGRRPCRRPSAPHGAQAAQKLVPRKPKQAGRKGQDT